MSTSNLSARSWEEVVVGPREVEKGEKKTLPSLFLDVKCDLGQHFKQVDCL